MTRLTFLLFILAIKPFLLASEVILPYAETDLLKSCRT